MSKVLAFLAALLACYALLLAKPELYFSKSVNYKNFTVRARGEAPASVEPSLDAAAEKLAASELYKENDSFEIIVPKSAGEFKFFTPFQDGAYSRVNPFSGAIFLAAADFSKGEIRREPGAQEFHRLSTEIAAAAARDQARRLFRPLSYLFRSDWEIRGYAAHVAGASGDYSPADACGTPASPEMEDFKYGLMLETIMKEDLVSFKDLLERNVSYEQAETRMRKTNCGG